MLVCHVRAHVQMPVYVQDGGVIFFSCAYCTFYDIPKRKPVPRGNKAGEAINYTGKKEKEVKLTGQEAELCRLNWPYFIA